jgi:hypothetical protein
MIKESKKEKEARLKKQLSESFNDLWESILK